MMPQPFLVIQPVPKEVYEDPPFLWFVLEQIWNEKLWDNHGDRAPGPLLMRELKLGDIAGSNLAEYLFGDPHVAAVFKITGPAIPPDIPEVR